MVISRWRSCSRCWRAGWGAPAMLERPLADRLSWAEIRRLALRHRKALFLANAVAVLTTLCSVPIPLLLPLLVDEVLLGNGDAALKVMDNFLPAHWETAAGYI